MNATVKTSFFFALIISMLSILQAQAQIVYTDVNPDQIHTCTSFPNCTSSYSLDLNNDGTNDFTIFYYMATLGPSMGSIRLVVITPLNGNAVSISSQHPSALAMNSLVAYTSSWDTSANQTLRYVRKHQVHNSTDTSYGNWTTSDDKYLGLKLSVGTLEFYGWIRLTIDFSSTTLFTGNFTVKNFAYDSIPNQSIQTGDTGTGLTGIPENSSSHNFSIFSFNNKTLQVCWNTDVVCNRTIIIHNTIGQELKKIKIEKKPVQIDMNDYSSGLYFVTIQCADAIETKRFYLN